MDTKAKEIVEKVDGIVTGWFDADGNDDDLEVAARVAMALPAGMAERDELRILVDMADRIRGQIHEVLSDLHLKTRNPVSRATLTKRIACELRELREMQRLHRR